RNQKDIVVLIHGFASFGRMGGSVSTTAEGTTVGASDPPKSSAPKSSIRKPRGSGPLGGGSAQGEVDGNCGYCGTPRDPITTLGVCFLNLPPTSSASISALAR